MTLASSFGLFVGWSLMDILKEEWEFHNREGLMVTPALFHFIFSVFQSYMISVFGYRFTDYNI